MARIRACGRSLPKSFVSSLLRVRRSLLICRRTPPRDRRDPLLPALDLFDRCKLQFFVEVRNSRDFAPSLAEHRSQLIMMSMPREKKDRGHEDMLCHCLERCHRNDGVLDVPVEPSEAALDPPEPGPKVFWLIWHSVFPS